MPDTIKRLIAQIITYLDIELRKFDKVLGVIANIRLIVFSKQS